jgi:ferritin
VGFGHNHHMARHKGADISHDDKLVGFMQNAGIDIRINKVGQPATLEFSTKWAIYHWNLP